MRELALFFCVIIGLCVGMWAGNKNGIESGRSYITDACRTAGAFHHKRTGFKCERVGK